VLLTARWVLPAMLLHHAHCALADFWRKLR
jgi:hypothetical protein